MTEILTSPTAWALLLSVGLLAGFVDAIVGGGGMLTVPALLSLGLPPHLALGTNKLSSSFGSGTATFIYFRKKLFDPGFWKHSFYSTVIGAISGTVLINFINTYWLNKLLPVIIFFVAIYSFFSSMDDNHQQSLPKKTPSLRLKQRVQGVALGAYDGAFGPGTGAFWIISNIRLYRVNVLIASGLAKSMNFTSNFTALLTFIYFGQVNWHIGFALGSSLMIGAFIGTHSAIRFGAKFIRPIFITMVLIISLKLGIQAWF